MKTDIRRFAVWVVLFILLAVSAAALRPGQAQAAEVRLKKQEWTTELKTAKKKAVKVKAGKTTLISSGKMGYIQFTAPKAKKYTFTFSGLHTEGVNPEDDVNEGSVTAATPLNNKQIFAAKVRTEYGTGTILYLETETAARLDPKKKKKVDTPLPQRSAKLKLKKGQTIYFYCNVENYPWSLDLSIK